MVVLDHAGSGTDMTPASCSRCLVNGLIQEKTGNIWKHMEIYGNTLEYYDLLWMILWIILLDISY
jgi:hypothetical protein